MSEPWWARSAGPHRVVSIVTGPNRIKQPQLLPPSRETVAKQLRSLIKYFTPEWTNLSPDDAGVALLRLFSEQIEPALTRLNHLPEKAFGEFLEIAGIQLLPASSAKALLEFRVADGAPQSVLITRGFQAGARPAVGSGDLVVFETEDDLYAAPNKIEEAYSQQGRVFLELEVEVTDEPFLPFGKRGGSGRALLLGLSGEATPGPTLSLGIGVASPPGQPPPASSGGLEPLPVPPGPLLSWEILDGGSFKQLEIIRDETGGFVRSGVIELALPRQWRIGPRPAGLEGDKPLRWLQLRILFGQYSEGPTLSFIKLNMVSAIAARTIRDEVLQPVANSRGRVLRLSQTPILPKTLQLEVDEGELAAAEDGKVRIWKEVDDLSNYGPEDRVYVLDHESGLVTFGNGLQGMAVPPGFRNVRAVSYRVGGGAAGAVDAKAINSLVSSAPFINGVENPLPATGGSDTETQESALRRGPQEIRSRGRAVTIADYELMALRTPGAQVRRAHAVSGLHPSYPGQPIPGVVGIFIVPTDRNEGPPTPDEGTLSSVAEGLSKSLAPVGIEVAAAAPRYHKIRVELGVVVSALADEGSVVREVLKTLNTYFHPLTGGDDGNGWPFGGSIRNSALLRRLLAVEGVSAIPRLNIVLDGSRIRGCTDVAIAPHSLLWSEGHEVVVIEAGGDA